MKTERTLVSRTRGSRKVHGAVALRGEIRDIHHSPSAGYTLVEGFFYPWTMPGYLNAEKSALRKADSSTHSTSRGERRMILWQKKTREQRR